MGTGEIATRYHEQTKHTLESVRFGGRTLDWDNKPNPFKVYGDLPRTEPKGELATILGLGAGVLRMSEYGDERIYFRTYASAGALYPVEIYVVGDGGVWHFDPLNKVLELVREGDFAGTHLILTGIPWRTCWKYGDRGYRHLWWDAGTILANVLALAASRDLSARVTLGFDDDAVSRLVGVDGVREFPLCVVTLGDGELEVGDLTELSLAVEPLSPREERFPLIEEVHRAGAFGADEVAEWDGPRVSDARPVPPADVDGVIRRRGSARRFGDAPIPLAHLGAILEHATGVRALCVIHAVDGIEPGAYVWNDGELELVRRGVMRADAAFLCLEQRLGGEGAATLFLMTELDATLHRLGDRGYRVAQLAGGVALGGVYLAAQALGWGATGLTFYDDTVKAFFGDAAANLECMVACAIGERRGRLLPLV